MGERSPHQTNPMGRPMHPPRHTRRRALTGRVVKLLMAALVVLVGPASTLAGAEPREPAPEPKPELTGAVGYVLRQTDLSDEPGLSLAEAPLPGATRDLA